MPTTMNNSNETKVINIGTRKSQLALTQAELVQSILKKNHPQYEFNLVKIATIGDKILDKALSKIGEKSLFTKELEVALKDNEVDLVVHSLKDLPTTLPEGMSLGAILEREDPRDAVVMNIRNQGKRLEDLPEGSVVGTSSVRRISQLKRSFPNLKFMDIRGNLNTRLSKLDAEDGPYEALILAVAGLKRLGWEHRLSHALDKEHCLHAVSQGALGIEVREGDVKAQKIIESLNHYSTVIRCTAERSFMKELEGGCSVPIGTFTSFENDNLSISGMAASLDGKDYVHYKCQGAIKSVKDAEKLGKELADKLIGEGAKDILDSIKNNGAPTLPFGN